MTTAGTPQGTTAAPDTFAIGGDLPVHRLGYGAMQITGKGIWGPPADHDGAIAVLRRAMELGVDFIDTADSYGPGISEELIATRQSERQLRIIDHDQDGSMELKKREGYF